MKRGPGKVVARVWVCAGLIVMAAVGARGQTLPAGDASKGFADALATVKGLEGNEGMERMEARFVCERRLVGLDVPLASSGRVWVRAEGADGGGGMRLATEWPYVSEMIFFDGKVTARSQHEKTWTTTNQAARPGLTAMMVQMGRWSAGEAGRGELFAVARGGTEIPPRPGITFPVPRSMREVAGAAAQPGELFVLTPASKELEISVKRVTLGFVPTAGGKKVLAYMELMTAQNDVSRYWFFEQGPGPEGDMLKVETPRPGR